MFQFKRVEKNKGSSILKFFIYKKGSGIRLSIYLLLFPLLVLSLVLRSFELDLNTIPIIIIFLIFLLSQYFDFEYRYFLIYAIIMLITCPFLLVFDFKKLAEYFANYAYGFLVLGILGYFLDILREKIRKKGYFKIYRIVFMSLFIILLILPIIIYRENIIKLSSIIRTNFYIKRENIDASGSKIVKNILIFAKNPIEDSKISGWAIDTISVENSGIDKVVVFVDGKPGIGTYLDKEYRKVIEKVVPKEELLIRLFDGRYNKEPSNKDIIFWIHNIESSNVSIYDIIREFISSEEFLIRNLSDEEFLVTIYNILFNREVDNNGYNYWLTELNKGLDRNIFLDKLLDSAEFKNLVRDYYSKNAVHNYDLPGGINLYREDVGKNYGEQFEMSGFIFNFDSLKFENGQHKIYVYAHSSYSGWGYISFDIYINN